MNVNVGRIMILYLTVYNKIIGFPF
uniref:Uncharacterized protein n=1 Tax=Arundo donax TaxID=35708 RepID=A0A0A9BZS2_ARUDO